MVGGLIDAGYREYAVEAAISKVYSTECLWRTADEALQIFGGYGYTKMFPIEKLLRDARLFRIYEGTSEVQRYIVSGYAMNVYQPVMPPLEDLPIHREMEPADAEDKEGATVWRCRIGLYRYLHSSRPLNPTSSKPVF